MWHTHSRINTMMLSGHRRFPFGSKDPEVREKALDMMRKAIDLAVDLGIRNIQLAGAVLDFTRGNETFLTSS